MSPLRGAIAALLALCLTVPATLVQAPVSAQPTDSPQSGGVGIRLLEAPVTLHDDPRARSYIVDNLAPGTGITRRIEVSNSSDIEREISVYTGAASIGDDGGFQVAADRTANELTTWMSVSPSTTTLAPNTTTEVTVAIDVPRDAPEGEQYAVVWAQTAGERTSAGIQNVSRAGIRTYLSVGPGNGPPTDFGIDRMRADRSESGAPEVVAELTNTGGRALDPTGTLTLTGGPGGISTTPVTGSGESVAPGKTGTVTFILDPALPDGPWEAAIEISSGLTTRTSEGSLTFSDEGSTATAAEESSDGTSIWMWVTMAMAVALVLSIAAWVLMVRRRKAS